LPGGAHSIAVAACCSVLQRVAACCSKVALECEVGVEEEFLPGGVHSIIHRQQHCVDVLIASTFKRNMSLAHLLLVHLLFNATCRLLLYRRRHCVREREREKEREREVFANACVCACMCLCVAVACVLQRVSPD